MRAIAGLRVDPVGRVSFGGPAKQYAPKLPRLVLTSTDRLLESGTRVPSTKICIGTLVAVYFLVVNKNWFARYERWLVKL